MKPTDNIPGDVLGELRRLNSAASGLAGSTPLDDPRREAAKELCHYVVHLMDSYGVSAYELARAIGLNPSTLAHRLIARGLLPTKGKSIKPHKNAVSDRTGSRKTHCRRGHERTPENVGTQGHCLECRRISRRKSRGWIDGAQAEGQRR